MQNRSLKKALDTPVNQENKTLISCLANLFPRQIIVATHYFHYLSLDGERDQMKREGSQFE